jgi:hypothetical protein
MLEIKAVTEGKIEILFGTLNHLKFGFVSDLELGIWDFGHTTPTYQRFVQAIDNEA